MKYIAMELGPLPGGIPNPQNAMNISSPDFEHNGNIPEKFTCKGLNINPTLIIHAISPEVQSLVLIMDDPDAPNGTRDHRIIRNIPVIDRIEENTIPQGAIQGKNSRGTNRYGGPCPLSGTHRYFFKVYALDSLLDLSTSANKSSVEEAMQNHIIEQAEIIGLFSK